MRFGIPVQTDKAAPCLARNREYCLKIRWALLDTQLVFPVVSRNPNEEALPVFGNGDDPRVRISGLGLQPLPCGKTYVSRREVERGNNHRGIKFHFSHFLIRARRGTIFPVHTTSRRLNWPPLRPDTCA